MLSVTRVRVCDILESRITVSVSFHSRFITSPLTAYSLVIATARLSYPLTSTFSSFCIILFSTITGALCTAFCHTDYSVKMLVKTGYFHPIKSQSFCLIFSSFTWPHPPSSKIHHQLQVQGPWLTSLNPPQYPAHSRCLIDKTFNWILHSSGGVPALLADVYARVPPRYRPQSISAEDREFTLLRAIAMPSFCFFSALRFSPTDFLPGDSSF